jgi:xylulokinase
MALFSKKITHHFHLSTRMASSIPATGNLYLGLDSSTQGLKATIIDENLNIVSASSLNYQKEFGSKYKISSGVIQRPGNVVRQPTLMYVEALDLLLSRMNAEKIPFNRIVAVSGSGQQHGSVYFKNGSRKTLQTLSATSGTLASQLANSFSTNESPMWMDSSTHEQCVALEKGVGSAVKLASISGSRAYERFTGNQITKIAQDTPSVYENTERISLISSFMASLLIGDYAPIDSSDGCGMNLLDVRSKKWSPEILNALPNGIGKTLPAKLGAEGAVASYSYVGSISSYFQQMYGFSKDTSVIAWSGDNPCSVAGLGLRNPGDLAVSMGTSDCVFGIIADATPGVDGHVFTNPVDNSNYMAMLCYQNGSVTREKIRDLYANKSWDDFNKFISTTSPGNNGKLGFYFLQPEITPTILNAGIRRFDNGKPVSAPFSPQEEVRAILEGQFLSMRLYTSALGLKNINRILATGGASSNSSILQVLSDVFQVPVYTAEQTDSASLGAAYRALHGWVCKQSKSFVPFDKVLAQGADAKTGASSKALEPIKLKLAVKPNTGAASTYAHALSVYAECAKKVNEGNVPVSQQ